MKWTQNGSPSIEYLSILFASVFGFYNISTFVGYLMANQILYK